MELDFSNYELSNKRYGGSEKKLGILINDAPYMLKFQKDSVFGKRFNHISEYLGSHIFSLLDFDVHETYLGTYKGENVVACKDFVVNGYQFVAFNDVGESSIDGDKANYQYSYEDIVSLLESNKKLTNVEGTISSFFDVYIVDALIGNFDRHGANWGFLKKDNKYTLAPVFDNGSCLFPQMIDEKEMSFIISSEEEINKRVYQFPTSQIKLHNNKSSYFDVISSLQFEECNLALKRIYPKIDLEKIFALIDGISSLSDVHRSFYKKMIEERYNKILKFSYLKEEGNNG